MSNIIQGGATKAKIISQVTKQATCYATTATANIDISSKAKYNPAAFTSYSNYSVNEKSLLTRFKNYMSSQRKDKVLDPFKPWPQSLNPYTGECGGPTGPEPTRYGDWERKGRCSDF